MQVAAGGGHHARGVGAGVELVLRENNQSHFQGPGLVRLRFLAAELMKELRRMAQAFPGFDRLQAGKRPRPPGDSGGDLAQHSLRFAQLGLDALVGCVLVEVGQHAHGGAQRFDGWRPGGQAGQQVAKPFGQMAGSVEAVLEAVFFAQARQFAAQQQLGHFLKGAMLRQFTERVTPVGDLLGDAGDGSCANRDRRVRWLDVFYE